MINKKILGVGLLGLLMVACSSNKAPIADPTANNPNSVTATNVSPVTNDTTVNAVDTDGSSTDNANPNGLTQATNAIYFAVNKYDIDTEYENIISYNADYLAAHKVAHVKVDGNTDDTGSVEYNLALGQRRADAVKRALIAKGANEMQVEAVSNGKLAAKFSNHTEDGRSQNRRTDIVYTKQAPAGYHLDQNGLPAVK